MDEWNRNKLKESAITVLTLAAVIFAIALAYVYKKDEPRRAHDELLASWEAGFHKLPNLAMREEKLSEEDQKSLEKGLRIIEHNREAGITPCWRNLNPGQLVLLFGDSPVGLYYRHHKGVLPCYFDKDRNGIIISWHHGAESGVWYAHQNPKCLAEVDPDLAAFASKFHLKESKYVPGIYGLDPAYTSERIEHYVLED